MEVTFRNLLKAYSGKCDGLVYYYNRRLDKVMARRLPDWTPNRSTDKMTRIMNQMKTLEPSEGFRRDMKYYMEMYRFEAKRGAVMYYSWYNVFMSMMFRMSQALEIELETVTRAMIYDENLPCRNVKMAVEAGLLVPVLDYERLDRDL